MTDASGQCAGGTERFLYMAVIECPGCEDTTRHVEKLDFELPLDGEVPRPPFCPQCGADLRNWEAEWDIQAEYQIETVLPSEERSLHTAIDQSGGDE